MVSLTTSLRFDFLDVEGAPGALTEWEPGFVAVSIPSEQWRNAELTCRGRAMPLYLREFDGVVHVVADWPRSSAGNYDLELDINGSNAARRTWSIKPSKISAQAFESLLARLQDELPASLAVAMQEMGALTGIELLSPDETTLSAELLRIRRAIDGTSARQGLREVLPRIARDPHQALTPEETWSRREVARRIDPNRLAQAFYRANNLTSEGELVRVPENPVRHEVDVMENRLVKAFHGQVERRLRRLANSAALGSSADEIAGLRGSLRQARSAARFLDDVTDAQHTPTRFSMVLLRRADYRQALEGYLEFRRSTRVEFKDSALEAPINHVPYLFETWCVLEVIAALIAAAGSSGYRITHQRVVRQVARQLYVDVLRSGRPAIELASGDDQTDVRLIPQRTYGVHGQPAGSISFSQRPDIAIEVRKNGELEKIVILDPKYKLRSEEIEGEVVGAQPTKTDIDAMHSYRDAIRDSKGARVVSYAAIIYPGPLVRFSSGLAALPADPANPGELRSTLIEELQRQVFTEREVAAAP